MELQFLEDAPEAFTAVGYIARLDDARAVWIAERLTLLEAYGAGDTFPDPPVAPVPGVPGVFQFLVDYRGGEVHRVFFGANDGVWLVVFALRQDDEPLSAAQTERVRAAWDLRPGR